MKGIFTHRHNEKIFNFSIFAHKKDTIWECLSFLVRARNKRKAKKKAKNILEFRIRERKYSKGYKTKRRDIL